MPGRFVVFAFVAAAWSVSPAGAETIYQTDFSGGLDANWTTYCSDPRGRAGVKQVGLEPSSALKFDIKGSSTAVESLNAATLLLDLSGYQDLSLSLDHYVHLDGVDEFVDDSFAGYQNADGIAISGDGSQWHALWSPASAGQGWTRDIHLNLDDLITQHGLSTSAFQIRFQYFGRVDNGTLRSDGRAFDNVSLTGTPVVGVVPEPGTALLTVVGLCCGMGVLRFRRRTAARPLAGVATV